MDLPNDMIDKICAEVPNAKRAKQGVIIEKDGQSLHIFGFHSAADIEAVGQDGLWFLPFCSHEEITRILNPQSSKDELLKLRAEAIVDSPRLVRVFRSRKGERTSWSLTNYYESFDVNSRYLSNISKGNKDRLKSIPTGSAYIEQANAMCIKTNHGNVIAISEPIQHYLYFMNLFYFGEGMNISHRDRFHSFLIASRIMAGFESNDFDLDPRCILPMDIELFLRHHVSLQSDFIIGHEYAHHILGHLKDTCLTPIAINNHSKQKYTGFRYRHKNEYDADHHAVKFITGNLDYKTKLTDAAFQVLLYFHMSHLVKEYAAPRITQGTHPSPLDRIHKLRKITSRQFGRSKQQLDEEIANLESFVGLILKNWLPYYFNEFETTGSFYLPSYKQQILVDRIDF